MEIFKDFDIQIYKLSNKLHAYEYLVSNEFFGRFEGELVETGKIKINVGLDKRENLIEANIAFNGFVNLVCDRSLSAFEHPIALEKKVLFKYGEEEAELEDNVFVITKNTQTINLSHYIYETVALEIPLKKIHPDEKQDDEEENQYYYIDEATTQDQKTDEEIDPRWAALKNLKHEN